MNSLSKPYPCANSTEIMKVEDVRGGASRLHWHGWWRWWCAEWDNQSGRWVCLRVVPVPATEYILPQEQGFGLRSRAGAGVLRRRLRWYGWICTLGSVRPASPQNEMLQLLYFCVTFEATWTAAFEFECYIASWKGQKPAYCGCLFLGLLIFQSEVAFSGLFVLGHTTSIVNPVPMQPADESPTQKKCIRQRLLRQSLLVWKAKRPRLWIHNRLKLSLQDKQRLRVWQCRPRNSWWRAWESDRLC